MTTTPCLPAWSLLLLFLTVFATAHAAKAPVDRCRFVAALAANKSQHILVFGTSLTKNGAWVPQLKAALDERYPGLVRLTNSAKSGKNSNWGVDNVELGVVAEKPDAVFIEFAINDAVARLNLSPDQVRHNLDAILDRITQALPDCEIVLQVMNPVVGRAPGESGYRRNQHAYQQIYRDAARRRGLLLVDHSIAWNALLAAEGEAGFRRYVPDGIHPAPEGYLRFMTPTLLQAIGVDRLPEPTTSNRQESMSRSQHVFDHNLM